MKTLTNLFKYRVPGQLVVQLTDACNAECPHCGMRKSHSFHRKTLPIDDVKRSIDKAVENGVKAISFTGGEPMMRLNELITLINYAGEAGIPYIRTGTNGFFTCFNGIHPDKFKSRINRIAEQLAATPLRNFWFSVDSYESAVHEKMRGLPGVIRGMETALPIFHQHGIYPSVNLGINRNIGGILTSNLFPSDFQEYSQYLDMFRQRFTDALTRFYNRVIDMGFTILNTCYPMSVDPDNEQDLDAVYAATATDRIVNFNAAEKTILFDILMESVIKFRSKIRVFSPLTSLYTLYREYSESLPARHPSQPCRGGIDYFFIDSQTGNAYPCGYRGNDSLGKYWEIDYQKINCQYECRKCDWECFRDPSELFWVPLQLATGIRNLFHRAITDRQYLRYWLSDMRYYYTCRYFDGRKAPV